MTKLNRKLNSTSNKPCMLLKEEIRLLKSYKDHKQFVPFNFSGLCNAGADILWKTRDKID